MKDGKAFLGSISAILTYSLLGLIAWKAEVFGMVTTELILFMSGSFREVANNHTTFLMMFPIIFAVIIIQLPCSLGASFLQSKMLNHMGNHATKNLLTNMKTGNHFFTFFVIVLAEELFARWLFLGVLTKMPFLSGTVAFYILLLIGNSVWALIHLCNYDKNDRQVLRVLPQFIAGIFFAYVFVKYGLLAVVLAHFASNAILFSLHKVERFNMIDALHLGYAVLCVSISYLMLVHPLADILPWFGDDPVFQLQKWEFWDYVKVSVFFSSSFTILFSLLLYDRGGSEIMKSDKKIGPMHYIIAIPITTVLLYGIYSFLGLFINNVPFRMVILAILFTFLSKSQSGSAMTRSFWMGLFNTYITICILQAFDTWTALGFITVEFLVLLPMIALCERAKSKLA